MRRFLVLLMIVAGSATGLHAERRIALIVDTSGSMVKNDPPRYAVQISKILSDLVDDQDQVSIIRFPADQAAPAPAPRNLKDLIDRLRNPGGAQDCNVPADPQLVAVLTGSQRATFKSQVDRLLQYEGPTHFGAALRSAAQFLGVDRGTPRLLLMLSDAEEGFGTCRDPYTSILQRIGGSGAQVALVKLGGYAVDGFANNSAIQFREDVHDSGRLIGAVAKVYQRFLGSNKVQTGLVSGNITVKIDEHVKEAFLVVAAESPLGQLQSSAGNPRVDRIDLDYRSGGQTMGLDSRPRGYRIVRLTNPDGGSYTFSTPPGTSGGWMLIEDFALRLQLVSSAAVPADSNATVQFEVVDDRTGKRVTDNGTLSGLKIETVEPSSVSLTPDGPGVFSLQRKFSQPGQTPLALRMRGDAVDRTVNVTIDVAKITARLESRTQDRGEVAKPVPLRVKLTGNLPPPDVLIADTGSGRVRLNDKGTDGDETPGDGIYSGVWTPESIGAKKVRFEGGPGTAIAPIEIDIAVVGPTAVARPSIPNPTPSPTPNPPPSPPPHPTPAEPSVASPTPSRPSPPPPPPPSALTPQEISLGTGEPVTLDRLVTGGTAGSQLRLRDGRVDRNADIEVSTDLDKRHVTVEIQTAGGWQTLSTRPIRVPVAAGQSMTWPVRVRAAECPEACKVGDLHQVNFAARLSDGSELTQLVPLHIEIVLDAWYVCWRRELVAALLLLVGGIVTHGFLSPSRFARRGGVQVSPAEDLAEGFFYPFRAARGSRSGFYRDSQLYLSEDFRVSGRKNGGFVRLRADNTTVRIRPENGRTVWKQQADGTWEPLIPHQETVVHSGSLYRNDGRSLYFDVRTK